MSQNTRPIIAINDGIAVYLPVSILSILILLILFLSFLSLSAVAQGCVTADQGSPSGQSMVHEVQLALPVPFPLLGDYGQAGG